MVISRHRELQHKVVKVVVVTLRVVKLIGQEPAAHLICLVREMLHKARKIEIWAINIVIMMQTIMQTKMKEEFFGFLLLRTIKRKRKHLPIKVD